MLVPCDYMSNKHNEILFHDNQYRLKGIEPERVTGKIDDEKKFRLRTLNWRFSNLREPGASIFPCYTFHAPNRSARRVFLSSRRWNARVFLEFCQVYATFRILAGQNTVLKWNQGKWQLDILFENSIVWKALSLLIDQNEENVKIAFLTNL